MVKSLSGQLVQALLDEALSWVRSDETRANHWLVIRRRRFQRATQRLIPLFETVIRIAGNWCQKVENEDVTPIRVPYRGKREGDHVAP